MQLTSFSKERPYISQLWEQQRDLIEHIAQFSQNVLVVVAPESGGKSTFAQYCVKSPGSRLRKFLISAKLSSEQRILNKISEKLELISGQLPVDRRLLRSALERKLESSHQNWILYVDDADSLPLEELQAILEFARVEHSPKNQLHLVLFGGESLEKRINSPDFASITQGHCQIVELEPWSLTDIKNVAESFGTNVRLKERDLSQLYSKSKGWPGLFFQEIAMRSIKSKNIKVATKSPSKKDNVSMEAKKKKRILTNPVFLGMFMGIAIAVAYLVPHLWDEEDWSELPANTALMVTNTLQNSVINSTRVENDYDTDSSESLSQADEELFSQQDSRSRTMPLASNVPVIANHAKGEKSGNTYGYTKDEEGLLLSNSQFYTLELAQEGDASRALNFIARHGLKDDAALFRAGNGKKERFVVVYGQYPSASKALSALDKMPGTLQNDKVQPAVRELRGVQEEIRTRKEG
jgi:type II secretory pathway predicted ATPase ExeA